MTEAPQRTTSPARIWRAESGAMAAALPGGRLHLQHGPIDLVVSADGEKAAVSAAYGAAWARFGGLLGELVEELAELRRPARGDAELNGAVARRMARAVAPHAGRVFVTPMAAVAGSVADEILGAMTASAPLARAIVNNGGDIAVHLAAGQSARAAIADAAGRRLGEVVLDAASPARGLATSGRHGRSLSLGIADSVTVLAGCAAEADAAATLIANAVDLPGHPQVRRAPAAELDPDSDLGERLVVIEIGRLTPAEVDTALEAGRVEAERMRREGLIEGASLHLMGVACAVGADAALAA